MSHATFYAILNQLPPGNGHGAVRINLRHNVQDRQPASLSACVIATFSISGSTGLQASWAAAGFLLRDFSAAGADIKSAIFFLT